ncbi:hypothetical protein BR63_13290 [Thermanaerosceptrum fracticalcis]|uniref:MoaD family protein n=1 Tax=Thermanaerosceptrum fracticalcis TaxID=1712410 RepID=A0A7G6E536_THEFR|nr:MoaD/ThiS family protein [Thermanaerosceptrum fracticalcis]QNB47190.1 hypothetical protein BR63_13290 [Thermanaerosceptrum fracticalcis]
MQVKVIFHCLYRELAGVTYKYLELPEKTTLLDLVREMEMIYGRELTGQLIDYEKNEIWSQMALAVNGRIISDLDKFTYCLNENDEIIFLPPALGG